MREAADQRLTSQRRDPLRRTGLDFHEMKEGAKKDVCVFRKRPCLCVLICVYEMGVSAQMSSGFPLVSPESQEKVQLVTSSERRR